jgi:predicted amidophosphoribosyltransferase
MTHAIGGVLRALPWAFILLQLEVALFCVVAFQWGKRRGWNQSEGVLRQANRELQFQLVQAEERLAAEKRISKRLEVIVSQFSETGGERLRLVEQKGGGR